MLAKICEVLCLINYINQLIQIEVMVVSVEIGIKSTTATFATSKPRITFEE